MNRFFRGIGAGLVWIGTVETLTGARDPKLSVQIESVQSRTCRDGLGNALLELSFRLRFRNIGDDPIVLSRGAKGILEVLVSETAERLDQRRADFRMYLTRVEGDAPQPLGTGFRDDLFFTLPPHGSRDETSSVRIPSGSGNGNLTAPKLKEGQHYIRLVLRGWPNTTTRPDQVRQEWGRYGLVWSEDILTDAAPFEVSPQPAVAPCSPSSMPIRTEEVKWR